MSSKISPAFSAYLDITRFFAAILVLLYHANFEELIQKTTMLSAYGHSAVMIFFVLSGYVIAFVTETKEMRLKDYAISRMARIYSVVIPVLILTPLLDIGGEAMQSSFYDGKTTSDFWYVRIISSLFFLNELWFVSIMTFSNVPYWSLAYEVWYYILFAAMTFLHGTKRTVAIVCICLIVGPKILLLFPIWYLGVYIYRNQYFYKMSAAVGWIFWVCSLLLIIGFHKFGIQYMLAKELESLVGAEWYREMTFSKYFLSDYILAPLIAANFIGARAMIKTIGGVLVSMRPVIAYISGFTFILYLIHQPLLQFFAALINEDPNGYLFYLKVLLLVLATVWVLGYLTENKKRFWKKTFSNIYDKLDSSVFNRMKARE